MPGNRKRTRAPMSNQGGRRVINRARASVAKRVKRVEAIVSERGREKKCVTNYQEDITTLTAAAPTLYAFTCTQGTGDDNHIGNEVFLQDWVHRLQISWSRTASNFQAHSVRIVCGMIRTAAAGISASTVCTDLFGTATPDVDTMYALPQEEGRLGTKYIVVKDRVIQKTQPVVMYSTNSGNTTWAATPCRKMLTMKGSFKNNKAVFDDGSSTTQPFKSRPFILLITDSPASIAVGGGNEITYTLYSREFYTENKVF